MPAPPCPSHLMAARPGLEGWSALPRRRCSLPSRRGLARPHLRAGGTLRSGVRKQLPRRCEGRGSELRGYPLQGRGVRGLQGRGDSALQADSERMLKCRGVPQLRDAMRARPLGGNAIPSCISPDTPPPNPETLSPLNPKPPASPHTPKPPGPRARTLAPGPGPGPGRGAAAGKPPRVACAAREAAREGRRREAAGCGGAKVRTVLDAPVPEYGFDESIH